MLIEGRHQVPPLLFVLLSLLLSVLTCFLEFPGSALEIAIAILILSPCLSIVRCEAVCEIPSGLKRRTRGWHSIDRANLKSDDRAEERRLGRRLDDLED